MGRARGNGTAGPVRSTRLPAALDAWLESRLMIHRHKSSSEILVELIHGGLRLRDGYMSIHRRALEDVLRRGDTAAYAIYRSCLTDTFGHEYVEHLESWLEADGVTKMSTM
ncbi:MAG: hypothetical protein NVSMB64_04160 [Candidatus Velthaea sp.]